MLQQWSYVFLALTHRYVLSHLCLQWLLMHEISKMSLISHFRVWTSHDFGGTLKFNWLTEMFRLPIAYQLRIFFHCCRFESGVPSHRQGAGWCWARVPSGAGWEHATWTVHKWVGLSIYWWLNAKEAELQCISFALSNGYDAMAGKRSPHYWHFGRRIHQLP